MKAHIAVLLAAGAALAAAQTCSVAGEDRQDCYPWWYKFPEQEVVPTAEACHAQGCCWDPEAGTHDAACFYPSYPAPSGEQCQAVDSSRLDCYPEDDASEEGCTARGCCWSPSASGQTGVPYCFYPMNYAQGYNVVSSTSTAAGTSASLSLASGTRVPFGNAVPNLDVKVWEETPTRLHFKITDAAKARWEPPVKTPPPPPAKPVGTEYTYTVKQAPFSIEVARESSGETLFNSTVGKAGSGFGTLTYSNQYIEFSTHLPTNPNIYGLGEHITPLKLDTSGTAGQVYTMLARDQGTPVHNQLGNTNLYASQPLYLVLNPEDGATHGVFLLNSNAMDIVIHSDDDGAFITYRVLGGVLDFYIFTGPSPEAVVQQYLEVIGKPFLPPYWALGFHLCRWGYMTLQRTQEVNDNMRAAGLPQDVQWNDIDYMDNHLDFTSDPTRFPVAAYGQWVNTTLRQHGQHYVPIFDPAISSSQTPGSYPAFDDGLDQNVFIKNTTGGVFIGSVWPGLTAFPDFFSANASAYWTQQMTLWHDKVPFDSAWIDMNEPSNFCNGQCRKPTPPLDFEEPVAMAQVASTPLPQPPRSALRGAEAAVPALGDGFDAVFPPFLPGREGGAQLIDTKTVSFSAPQANTLHYNVHNMYGWSENKATLEALEAIRGERSFTISRSTFPSSGVHGGHWLGDNTASWDDLYYSIPGLLSMQLYGIPLVGADVCGFGGSTTAELCTRWQQLGAFYPFYRNHNTKGAPDQAPYVFGEPYTSAIRDAITLRYSLLPHLYTLFFRAHTVGGTVARPLFFEWPTGDASVIPTLDRQFLWGSSLMVSPVLTQGATSVSAYFPDAPAAADQEGWFDWFTGARLQAANTHVTLPADISTLNVHVRGGGIVPAQDPAMTTTFARDNAFRLHVAMRANNGTAEGSLTVDDGVALDTVSAARYLQVAFAAAAGPTSAGHPTGTITSKVLVNGYTPPANATLWSVRVLNVCGYPATGGSVFCNQRPAAYSVDATNCVLNVDCTTTTSVPAARAGEFLEDVEGAEVDGHGSVQVTQGVSLNTPLSIVYK